MLSLEILYVCNILTPFFHSHVYLERHQTFRNIASCFHQHLVHSTTTTSSNPHHKLFFFNVFSSRFNPNNSYLMHSMVEVAAGKENLFIPLHASVACSESYPPFDEVKFAYCKKHVFVSARKLQGWKRKRGERQGLFFSQFTTILPVRIWCVYVCVY